MYIFIYPCKSLSFEFEFMKYSPPHMNTLWKWRGYTSCVPQNCKTFWISKHKGEIIWWNFVLQWSCARNIIVANIKRSRCYKNYTLLYFSLLLCTRAVKMAHSYKKFLWKAKYTWIPFIANLWFIIYAVVMQKRIENFYLSIFSLEF